MRIAIMSNEKASIVCFEQFIEAFLTESSKSPALIAKSNKQWVGTQTSGEVSWKDCPTIDYRCRYKSGKYPGL